MKTKDLPKEVKDMYGFEYKDFLKSYIINGQENIALAVSENTEFTEDGISYRVNKNDTTIIMSKGFKHIAIIIN